MLQSLREGSENAYVVRRRIPDRANTICWVSFKNGQPAALSSSSIRIGELLHERLFSRLKSLVMVSATLTIEDSFSYFIEKNGLQLPGQPGARASPLAVFPFDYDQQAMLLSLYDMPDPTSADFSGLLAATLKDILQVTQGRTMVLFTSRRELQQASRNLRDWAEEQGICLLVQGEDGGIQSPSWERVYSGPQDCSDGPGRLFGRGLT